MTLRARKLYWTQRIRSLNADCVRRRKQLAHARKRVEAHPKDEALAAARVAARRRLTYSQEQRREARAALAKVNKQLAHARNPLRVRAFKVAEGLLGVMEHGGNNQGPKVTEIIHANGGSYPEPWCGDFVAYCYRNAGSKSVTRAWAAVSLYLGVTGVKRTSNPKKGDLVRYNFSHIGLFQRDLGNGTIETIEGNTGSSGAVSDSSTGGDGVYRKIRSKSLVRDYLHVSR